MNQMAKEYIENRIRTASPMELVLILYEGATQNLHEARLAMSEGLIEKKINSINQASRFISELQASLDDDRGGEVAVSLKRLYRYFQRRLVDANVENSVDILDEIIRHLRGLHESWQQLARKNVSEPTREIAPPPARVSQNEPFQGQRISVSI